MTNWTEIATVTPTELEAARLEAHHAVQWTTRAARAVLEAKPDDSHSNLGWDVVHGALVSHDLPGTAGPVRVGLRIADLTLLWIAGGAATETLALEGHTDADAGAWVADRLESAGLSATRLANPLPYDMPSRHTAGGYEAIANADALGALAAWYGAGADVIGLVAESLSDTSPGPSPVRCWPHHFDIATLVSLETGDPETARAIGIGLAPGDEAYNEPYFYVNPWPHLAAEGLPDLPAPGHWHTAGFVGAVATGTHVVEQGDPRGATLAYLTEAVRIGREKLGK